MIEVDCASDVSINSPHARKVEEQFKRAQLNNSEWTAACGSTGNSLQTQRENCRSVERPDRKSPRARTRCTPRSRSLAARARRRDPGRRPGEVVEALSCCSRKQMMRPNTALPRHCPCRTSHCRWTLPGARPGAGPGSYVPK
jgi:hypothetical protein